MRCCCLASVTRGSAGNCDLVPILGGAGEPCTGGLGGLTCHHVHRLGSFCPCNVSTCPYLAAFSPAENDPMLMCGSFCQCKVFPCPCMGALWPPQSVPMPIYGGLFKNAKCPHAHTSWVVFFYTETSCITLSYPPILSINGSNIQLRHESSGSWSCTPGRVLHRHSTKS